MQTSKAAGILNKLEFNLNQSNRGSSHSPHLILIKIVQHLCVCFDSITNIGFLNVMAKGHRVNESAYYSDTGQWTTITSMYVA